MKVITFIILAVVAAAISVGYYFLAAQFDIQRNDIVKQNYAEKNFGGIYDFYFSGDPLIANRSSVGNPSAPITIIMIVDFESNESKLAYSTLIPQLTADYIDPGAARLIHKYYLSREEYDGKKGRFIYVLAAQCFDQKAGNQSIAFHQALFDATSPTTDSLTSLATRYGAAGGDFQACMQGAPPAAIYEDMLESDLFRIESPALWIGINNKDSSVLFGIPSLTRINQTIREKQISIGI